MDEKLDQYVTEAVWFADTKQFKKDLPLNKTRFKALFKNRQRLHLKVQQLAYQWAKLSEFVNSADPAKDEQIIDQKVLSRKAMLIGTLIFGCLAALYAAGIEYLPNVQPTMIRLSIWLGLGVYGVLFFHWHNKSFIKLFFPLWIGFSSAWISMSVKEYLVLTMGLLVWIRSGDIFWSSISYKRLGLEFLLSYGGFALISWLVAEFNISITWGVLIFFCLQCVYFIPSFGPVESDKAT